LPEALVTSAFCTAFVCGIDADLGAVVNFISVIDTFIILSSLGVKPSILSGGEFLIYYKDERPIV
jgi:hypothetical protein